MRSAKIDFHTRTQNRPSSKVIRLLLARDSDGRTYLCLSMKATGEACAKWYDGRELNDGCAANISHSSFPTSLKKPREANISLASPPPSKRDISIVRLIKNAIPSLVHGLFSSCVRDFKFPPLSSDSTIIFHGRWDRILYHASCELLKSVDNLAVNDVIIWWREMLWKYCVITWGNRWFLFTNKLERKWFTEMNHLGWLKIFFYEKHINYSM